VRGTRITEGLVANTQVTSRIWYPDLGAPVDPIAMLGTKAAGLLPLPPTWAPPYVVLTTALHREWQDGKLRRGWLRRDVVDLSMGSAVAAVFSGHDVIVRSSGVEETLEERGRMMSSVARPDYEGIEMTAEGCWRAAHDVSPGAPMALIVQMWKRPQLLGHLSNERRVSERHDSWLVEALQPNGALTPRRRIAAVRSASEAPLLADTEAELRGQLRRVAGWRLPHRGRRHFEWTWDGRRVWVVQCDLERVPRGRPPGSDWEARPQQPVSNLLTFVDACEASGPWQKADCVRTFASLELPTGHLYVLEDAKALACLANGTVPRSVQADVDTLVDAPVVVRSDTSPGSLDGLGILLPRTETCTSATQVTEFLIATCRHFVDHGLVPGDFCFLVHRFIPAQSGTYSIAAPDERRVRVDSIWGVPDGLLYLAHDSFEVDADGNELWQRIRCKSEYIDFASDGSWFEKVAGTEWDWKRSIAPDDLALVAHQARRIANHLRSPVEVMHFVSCHPASGLPGVLPWYVRTTERPSYDLETAPRFGWLTYLVRSPSDLERVEHSVASSSEVIASIRLRASMDHVHDWEFVSRVARVATTYNLPVDVEGSVLGHSFYMLRKAGVKVRSVDPEAPPEVSGARFFDKLVRDRIPGMIEGGGEHVVVRRATGDELLHLLRQKLVEEAIELHAAGSRADVLAEAADVIEVLRAIAMALGQSFADLVEVAQEKRTHRGGFEEGVVLKGTYVRPLFPVNSAQQLFSVAVDPTAEHRREASISLSPDEEGVLLRVSPLPSTRLPEQAVIEIPDMNVAIQARRDAEGIHLMLVPVPLPPNPAQRSLFDED
jgi:predicted house-cleaning noncanonical NTP pyrophosphatase (MazG superfamily)